MKIFKETRNAFLLLWNGTPHIDLLSFFYLVLAEHLYIFYSMEGGELFQRIQDRADGAFTERGIF